MKSLEITASGNAIAGAVVGSRIRGVALVGGSAASSAVIYDAATAAGTPIITIKALTSDFKPMMFPNDSGLQLKTGLSVTMAGASAILYVFLD
jgi:hypothetical protein